MSFDRRLRRIGLLEDEILRKASELMQEGRDANLSDLFVLGAAKRVLSLASGFRTLAAARNLTWCAGLHSDADRHSGEALRPDARGRHERPLHGGADLLQTLQ